jgi:hypothetical protein
MESQELGFVFPQAFAQIYTYCLEFWYMVPQIASNRGHEIRVPGSYECPHVVLAAWGLLFMGSLTMTQQTLLLATPVTLRF